MKIPYNIPCISGKEKEYIANAVNHSHADDYIAYTDKCKSFIKQKWGYKEVYLTASCTTALEVSSLLLDIKPGDEVIIPSYTFPSTANAFLRQGAKIILSDSRIDHPGINEDQIESLITESTRAIVPVHYAGVACDMDKIMKISEKYGLFVIEDAAHAVDGFYKNYPLGSIGHLGCLSFHRTKNIQCGEGGAIIINDKRFSERIVNIIEKGTNRQDFIEGKVEQYGWVDIGSSFCMSELHAAYLFAQLEMSDSIKGKRKAIWNEYFNSLLTLQGKGMFRLPEIPDYANHNAHLFYLILNDTFVMHELKSFLADRYINATVHYIPLNLSEYWSKYKLPPTENNNSLMYNECLLRLPLFNDMTLEQVRFVTSAVSDFFYNKI
jgi:dTDP-4-amino-4,6-dideoxygalactose transaminase